MAKDNRNQQGDQGSGQGGSGGQQQGGNTERKFGESVNQGDGQNSNDANIEGWEPGQVGEVQDPADGRLKENRMSGTTLGTTEHAKQAPNATEKGSEQSGSSGQYDGDEEGEGDQNQSRDSDR